MTFVDASVCLTSVCTGARASGAEACRDRRPGLHLGSRPCMTGTLLNPRGSERHAGMYSHAHGLVVRKYINIAL